MKTINSDLLVEMTKRLVEQFQPEQVILFGSYAWGVPDKFSDVDLMVIVSSSELSDYERSVQGHRCLSGLEVPKDIVVKTRAEFEFVREVRASLEHRIVNQGKILYDRGQKTARTKLAHQSTT